MGKYGFPPGNIKIRRGLAGQKAKKGVFITTSNFSKVAIEYASIIDSKLVLIDGNRLAQLMIDHDIVVSKFKSYDIKKSDVTISLKNKKKILFNGGLL